MDQKTNLTIKPSLIVFICILADTHLNVLGSRLLDTGLLKKSTCIVSLKSRTPVDLAEPFSHQHVKSKLAVRVRTDVLHLEVSPTYCRQRSEVKKIKGWRYCQGRHVSSWFTFSH